MLFYYIIVHLIYILLFNTLLITVRAPSFTFTFILILIDLFI